MIDWQLPKQFDDDLGILTTKDYNIKVRNFTDFEKIKSHDYRANRLLQVWLLSDSKPWRTQETEIQREIDRLVRELGVLYRKHPHLMDGVNR